MPASTDLFVPQVLLADVQRPLPHLIRLLLDAEELLLLGELPVGPRELAREARDLALQSRAVFAGQTTRLLPSVLRERSSGQNEGEQSERCERYEWRSRSHPRVLCSCGPLALGGVDL